MKRRFTKMAAGIAAAAILATSIPSTQVYASSSSVFPAAGAMLATGNGISFNDIKANIARNAAKRSKANAAVQGDSDSALKMKKASIVSTSENEDDQNQ